MNEAEIKKEAMKRAKEDAIKEYGEEVLGTVEKRKRLDYRSKMNLILFLNRRAKYWIEELTPKITQVWVDGKKLEEVDDGVRIEWSWI